MCTPAEPLLQGTALVPGLALSTSSRQRTTLVCAFLLGGLGVCILCLQALALSLTDSISHDQLAREFGHRISTVPEASITMATLFARSPLCSGVKLAGRCFVDESLRVLAHRGVSRSSQSQVAATSSSDDESRPDWKRLKAPPRVELAEPVPRVADEFSVADLGPQLRRNPRKPYELPMPGDWFDGDSRPIVLYDGEGNIGEGVVNQMLESDAQNRLRFCSLNSSDGLKLLERCGQIVSAEDPPDEKAEVLHCTVLVEPERCYFKVDAYMRIAIHLDDDPYKNPRP